MLGRVLDDDVMDMGDTVNVDDDNSPDPRKIPCVNENIEQLFGEWGHDGICFRHQPGG